MTNLASLLASTPFRKNDPLFSQLECTTRAESWRHDLALMPNHMEIWPWSFGQDSALLISQMFPP